MDKYNYAEFSSNKYNLDSFHGPGAGDKAPDFLLSTLDGEKVNLLDFPGDFLILELGSISCPLFQGRRAGMSELFDEFPDQFFSILYIREAHPGSRIAPHKIIEDKVACARQLRNDEGEKRNILIDDIAGTAHQSYGGYPNAIFIINKNACVVFRSDWNSVSATRKALNKLINGQPAQTKSYFLPPKLTVAIRTLRHSGQGALKDFLVGLPVLIWKNIIRRNTLLFFSTENPVAPDVNCKSD